MSAWSLATVVRGDGPEIAVLAQDGTLRQPPALKAYASLVELIDDWSSAEVLLRSLDALAGPVIADGELVVPLQYPRKVICAGVNYRRHVEEMGVEQPGEGWEPFFFLKPPTTTVVGPVDDIPVDTREAARLDWEAELAVVIGRGGRDIDPARAGEHIAGYCVSNDLTARGYHRRDNVPSAAFAYDWIAAKAQDASLPIGPGVTPAWLVPDPQNLRIRLWVNDQLQQDGNTADMICDIPTLVAAASASITLEPGDLIPTGTPAGVGAARGLALRPGDVVRTRIEVLGELVNRIIAR